MDDLGKLQTYVKNNCKYCGSLNIKYERYRNAYRMTDVYHARCGECGELLDEFEVTDKTILTENVKVFTN